MSTVSRASKKKVRSDDRRHWLPTLQTVLAIFVSVATLLITLPPAIHQVWEWLRVIF